MAVKKYCKKVICTGNSRLPSGYTELEYLESNGTQFIQLNYGFYKTDEIDFKFSEVPTGQETDKFMVSPSSWNTDSNRFGMGIMNASYTMGYGSVTTGTTALQPKTRYTDNNPHIWHYKNYVCSVENPTLSQDYSSITFGIETTNLKLFYGYNANTKGAIYYWKHKKVINGVLTLVEDLVPAKRNSDDVIGMYDLVSNTFFTNGGTGDFIAGGVVKTLYTYYKVIIPIPNGDGYTLKTYYKPTLYWQDPEIDYLCFEAVEATDIAFTTTGTIETPPVIEYKINDGDWSSYTLGNSISLAIGDKCYWKGDNSSFSTDTSNYIKFTSTGNVNASGNIMTLLDSTGVSLTIPTQYCFCSLFRNCTKLLVAPDLPATTLTTYCYSSMFYGCTGLTEIPDLVGYTSSLASSLCYSSMFYGCTGLTSVNILNLTHVDASMFAGCSSIIGVLAPNVTSILSKAFQNCSSLQSIHAQNLSSITETALLGALYGNSTTHPFIVDHAITIEGDYLTTSSSLPTGKLQYFASDLSSNVLTCNLTTGSSKTTKSYTIYTNNDAIANYFENQRSSYTTITINRF